MLKKLSQVRVRWWIFTLMFLVGFVAYLQQKTLTIAAASMEPDLSLSQLQISWLRAAFIMGYAFFQFPAGVIGEYLGARRTFTLAGLLAIGAMMAMPVVPSVLHGNSLFIAMMLSQGLLGISQSVVWPVSAGVLSRWFPSSQWAFILGLQTMSLSIASMITPPLISHLMTSHSWQHAFFIAALPAIPLVLIWGWYGRNSPQEHTAVSAQELQELDVVEPTTGHSQPQTPLSHRIVKLLKNKNILLLTFSYLTMNYVFYLVGDWCFLYLAQERHFSILESGWLAALPPMGAAIGAGVGGIITTLLCVRLGQRWGLRLMPLITLPLAGILLLITVGSENAYLAVMSLTLCYACIELNEGAYWAATMNVAPGETMAATGVLNTGGNLGGVVASPIVGYLSGSHHWNAVFLIGVGFAAASALAWCFIDGHSSTEESIVAAR